MTTFLPTTKKPNSSVSGIPTEQQGEFTLHLHVILSNLIDNNLRYFVFKWQVIWAHFQNFWKNPTFILSKSRKPA